MEPLVVAFTDFTMLFFSVDAYIFVTYPAHLARASPRAWKSKVTILQVAESV